MRGVSTANRTSSGRATPSWRPESIPSTSIATRSPSRTALDPAHQRVRGESHRQFVCQGPTLGDGRERAVQHDQGVRCADESYYVRVEASKIGVGGNVISQFVKELLVRTTTI